MIFYSTKKRLIDIINNNQYRLPILRRFLNRAIDLLETPWFFLNKPPRCYIRPGLSVENFFNTLKKRNVEYVVLRWFEKLPLIQVNEDIDMLIRDSHLIRIYDLITYKKTGQSLDIYTVAGQYQKIFRGQPYYPVWIGKEILKSRVIFNKYYYVPDDKSHFLSLIYHLIFHKGEKYFDSPDSSLIQTNDHNYRQIISDLSNKLRIQLSGHSAEDYFEILRRFQWAPGMDYLRFLSRKNPWLARFIPSLSATEEKNEIILFIIRRWAIDNNATEYIIDQIDKNHEILLIHALNPDEIVKASQYCRGGNWSRGPFLCSGGNPAIFVVAYDDCPQEPDPDKKRAHPYIKNQNIYLKEKIRFSINNTLPFYKRANPIHSTDDENEALEVLEKVNRVHYENISRLVKSRRACKSAPKLVKIKSNSRSKIEIYNDNGKIYVKKSFRPQYDWHYQNEILAHRDLASKVGHIPNLVDLGENYFVTEFITNILPMTSNREKICILRKNGMTIVQFMKGMYQLGYALIDFKPENVLIGVDGKILFIDFEFLHKYVVPPKNFKDSYDIVGFPRNSAFPLPGKLKYPGRTWENTWNAYLGKLEWYL
jgi:hypothetical protein